MSVPEFILYVADQARARAFYAAVLGRGPVLDVPGMTEFDLGGALLGLMPQADIEELLGGIAGGPGQRAELYLRRVDAVAAIDRALASGGRLLSPLSARAWGDVVGYVLDPDGHVLAIAAEADAERSRLLLIGGRSGSGKTRVAGELHALLAGEGVRHAVIEGDALDLAHPEPWEHRLAARNLASVWANYRALGHRRLVYTNTVSPLEAAELAAAMGDDPEVTVVVLRARDDTVEARLAGREEGEELAAHLRRSRVAAARLDAQSPAGAIRIDTDGRESAALAREIRSHLPW